MCIYIHTHSKSTCGKMNFKKISLHNTEHTQLKYCLPTSFSRDGSPPPSSRLLQEDRAEGDEVSMLVSGPGPGEKLIPRRAPDPSLAGRLRGLGPQWLQLAEEPWGRGGRTSEALQTLHCSFQKEGHLPAGLWECRSSDFL